MCKKHRRSTRQAVEEKSSGCLGHHIAEVKGCLFASGWKSNLVRIGVHACRGDPNRAPRLPSPPGLEVSTLLVSLLFPAVRI